MRISKTKNKIKQDFGMTHKYIIRCPATLVIRKIKKKSHEIHQKIRKSLAISSVGEDVEQQESKYTLGKFKGMPPLWKTVWHCLLKLSIPHGTATPLLYIHNRDVCTAVPSLVIDLN